MNCTFCKKPVVPNPINPQYIRHKLVLDIDETLLHSSRSFHNSDAIITTTGKEESATFYVTLRPYAREFIVNMNKFFDIYFYSASCLEYIKPLVRILDPYRLSKGIFSRKHCYQHEGCIIKDLSKVTKQLDDVVLVDVLN